MTDPPDVRVTRASSHRLTDAAVQDAAGNLRVSAAHLAAPLMDMSSANLKTPLATAGAAFAARPTAAQPRAPDMVPGLIFQLAGQQVVPSIFP